MEMSIEPILIFKIWHVSDVRKYFQPGTMDRSVHHLSFADGAVRVIASKYDQARNLNLRQRFSVITSQSAPTKSGSSACRLGCANHPVYRGCEGRLSFERGWTNQLGQHLAACECRALCQQPIRHPVSLRCTFGRFGLWKRCGKHNGSSPIGKGSRKLPCDLSAHREPHEI